MNITKILVPGLLILAAMGCAANSQNTQEDSQTQHQGEVSIEEMRAQSLAEIDQDDCDAKGGDVRQQGMMGLWRCIMPYSDAGNICSEVSDCVGLCLAHDGTTDYQAQPGQAKGLCQRNDSPFGCYAEIRDSTIQATLCVD